MLLDLEEYKDYAKITSIGMDTQLTTFADEAEAIIQGHLGRTLDETSYTDYYDGTNSDYLILDNYPIQSVDAISVYEEGVYQAIDTSEYHLMTFNHKIVLDGYIFLEGVGNYKVEYTAGFGTLPKDIRLALKKLFVILLNESPLKNNTLGMASFIKQNEKIYIDTNAEKKILESISKYRVYNV